MRRFCSDLCAYMYDPTREKIPVLAVIRGKTMVMSWKAWHSVYDRCLTCRESLNIEVTCDDNDKAQE